MVEIVIIFIDSENINPNLQYSQGSGVAWGSTKGRTSSGARFVGRAKLNFMYTLLKL